MANYNVQITNGTGNEVMQAGTYSVSVSANGYDATSLSPTTYTATADAGSGTFTLSADGVLTIVFNETGAEGGTPITSGSVVMTDSTGATQYGSAVSISAQGVATFNNVPFNATTPYQLYFKQLSSDGTHNLYTGVISVSMSAQAQTEYVLNSLFAEQSFSLNDANYGFPIESATLDFASE